ncbi:MAG: Multidrug resistance protein MdtC [Elusimicrobia bacterium]|nr:Multidrug resistance protein MdtC [Elusimicrobiota bacterium]
MSAYQLTLLAGFTVLVISLARRFPQFALSRPVALLVSLVGLGLGGVLAFFFMPVELMPNASFGVITITTPVRGGMSPTDVENLISKPIEEAVSSVAHVRDIFSNSKTGKSVVSLEFEPGIDMDFAALDVREKFAKVQGRLPKEIEHPVIAHYRESDVPVLIFALTSEKRSPEELRTLVDGGLKEKLLRVKGVANVDIAGGRERKIIIDVDRHRLAAQGMDIREVVRAIESSNLNVQTGAVQTNAMTTSIRAVGQFVNLDEIGKTVIGISKQGTSIYVKDVAQIRDSYMEQESLSRLNESSSVTVYIQKESSANTVQVVKQARQVLEPFQKDHDSDIRTVEISNQAEAIQQAISSVRMSLFFGIFLVMAVLGFFLGLKPALAVAVSIPLATLVTGSVMYMEGLSLNVMTLSGLALGIGLLVDNSIVVLETIYKALAQRGDDLKALILRESSSVSPAIIGGTITTIVVFIPFLLLSKQVQIIYAGVAITITAALISSLYVALTTVPSYVLRTFSRPLLSSSPRPVLGGDDTPPPANSRFKRSAVPGVEEALPQAHLVIQRLQDLYSQFLPKVLEMKGKFLGGLGLLFLLAVYMFQFHIDKNLSQGDERNEFIVFVELPSGKRMEISDEIVKEVESKIRAHEKTAASIENITTRIEGWSSKVYVGLKPANKRKQSTEEIIESLRPVVKDIGREQDAFVYFSSPKEGQELIVNIYGQEEKVVADYAIQVSSLFDKESGFIDTKIRYRPGRPEVKVIIDPRRAALFGLTPADVGHVLHAGTRGLRATYYREKGEEIETVVRLKVDQRESVDSVKTLLIPSPRGGQVPLAQIADFDFSLAPSEIWRHNKERMIQVSATVSKMSLEKAAEKAKRLLAELPFNGDYWAAIGGDYHDRLQAQRDFQKALLITAILIFAVLACLFESILQPLLLFVSVPLAVIGIVLALLVTRTPVTMGVMIGILMTGGIAVNNAILLIERFNAERKKNQLGLHDLLMDAGRDRLRPILMTTATTVLGLLPMALDHSAGAELWRPMAITTIGGLLISMALTLFVLPCLIVYVEDFRLSRLQKTVAKVSFKPSSRQSFGRTDTLVCIMPVRTDQDHCGTVRDPGSPSGKNLGPGQKHAGETAFCARFTPLDTNLSISQLSLQSAIHTKPAQDTPATEGVAIKKLYLAIISVFAAMMALTAFSHASPSTTLPAWVDQMVTRRVNDLLTQGRVMEKNKQYPDAIEIYLEAVTLAPTDLRAREYLLRANAQGLKVKRREHEKRRMGLVSQAQDKRRANRATAQALEGRISEAQAKASRGRFPQACDGLLSVVNDDPTYVPAIKALEDLQNRIRKRLEIGGKFSSEDEKQVTEGFLYFTEKKWNSALEAWRPVFESVPLIEKWGKTTNLAAYVAKANQNALAQERQNKIDQSIASGLKSFRESRLEEAQQAFEDALKLDPSNAQAQQYVRLIPGLLESARQNVLSEVKQQQINTALSDAMEFYLKGYFDEAESKVRMVLEESPQHAGALALSEDIREARGLPKLPSLNDLRTKEQLELEELYSQGIISFAEGKMDEAKKSWETILLKDPNHANAKRALKKINDEN